MDIARIEDSRGANVAEMDGLRSRCRRCLLYREEACSAPSIRFEACRTCFRINPKMAVRTLFEKIKTLALQLINLETTKPEQLPPEPPLRP